MKTLKTFALLFMFLLSLASTAQRERNYIYLLDCTKSMTGYGEGNPNIWQRTKDYLKADLAKHARGTTLHVVPFQDAVQPGFHFLADDMNWDKIEGEIDQLVQQVTHTNICAAWDASDKYIDPHKDNYIILLTDGRDNVRGMEALAKKLVNWCGKYPHTYAFYVLLTEAAADHRIADVINICENEFLVDAIEGIPVFGSIEKDLVIYGNTLNLKKVHKIGFSSAGEYEATALCCDPYFDVKVAGGKIKQGVVPVQVVARKAIADINAAIPETYNFTFQVQAKGVEIINPVVNVQMTNKPERTLETLSQETDMGKATWYDSFGFWGASKPDTLHVDLKALFNDEAKKDGAIVEFALKDVDGCDDFQLLFRGKPVQGRRILLSSSDTSASILSIVFNPDAKEGARYLTINVASKSNLDKINDAPVEQYTLTLRSKYGVGWNPLKTMLFWLCIVVLAALLLWFLIFRHLVYPPISVKTLQINEPYFSKLNVKGKYRVVFTNEAKHQGMLSRIFKGEILYKRNEVWTAPLVLEAGARKRTLRVVRTKDYAFDPITSSLKAPADYTIENLGNKAKIHISIN